MSTKIYTANKIETIEKVNFSSNFESLNFEKQAHSTEPARNSDIDWSDVRGISKDNIFLDQQQTNMDWTQFRLPKEKVEEFWKEGFISHIPILTEFQCDRLLAEMDEYMSGDKCSHPNADLLYKCSLKKDSQHNSNVVHIQGQWRITQPFHDLVFHPKVVVPCAQLLKKDEISKVRFFHDQLISKPAKFSGVVGWHQDYSLWTKTGPPNHITVHIALCDQTLENGCIQYISGSHNWHRNGMCFDGPDFKFSEEEMDSIKKLLNDKELKEFKETPVLLKKGYATIHHSYVVHGSYANKSNGRRVAEVLNYIVDGVASKTDEPILTKNYNPHTQCANFKPGEKLEGKLFPVVFDLERGGLMPTK